MNIHQSGGLWFRHQGRGKMYGIELMKKSIASLEEIYGKSTIRIGAQLYLKKFYGSFQFEQSGEIYEEDGIEHIEMTRLPDFVE